MLGMRLRYPALLQVTDRGDAEAGLIRQLLLGQARLAAQVPDTYRHKPGRSAALGLHRIPANLAGATSPQHSGPLLPEVSQIPACTAKLRANLRTTEIR
jgi:hypothetical protein